LWFALALIIFIVEVITPNFIMASLDLNLEEIEETTQKTEE